MVGMTDLINIYNFILKVQLVQEPVVPRSAPLTPGRLFRVGTDTGEKRLHFYPYE